MGVALHGVLGKPVVGRDSPSIGELINAVSPLEHSSGTHPRTCSIVSTGEGEKVSVTISALKRPFD